MDSTKQAVKSGNPISGEINNHLTLMKHKILTASIHLETNENEITVDSVNSPLYIEGLEARLLFICI